MEMLSYNQGHGPYYRCQEGNLLRSVSAMLRPKGAGMGPADDAGAFMLALQRIRDADLLRPQPTLRACLRSRASVFEIYSQETSIGTCPLLLSFRTRRNYAKGTRTHDYFLDFSYVPRFRYTTTRQLAARCPAYSALDSAPDALLSEVRAQELSDGPEVGDALVHKSKARHWCRRNNAPCIAVCMSRTEYREALRPTYSLTYWPDPVPPKPDVETAFQDALRELRRPVSKSAK